MSRSRRAVTAMTAAALSAAACSTPGVQPANIPIPGGPVARSVAEVPAELARALQMVLVTTASWDTTGGRLQRYERGSTNEAWRAVGASVPVVVGRAGLGWDDALAAPPGQPVKREGDGRAPAGVFPLDTVFGFAPAAEAGWVRAPYLSLSPGTDCVDDVASVHYNTVVDRGAVPRVDWTSAEHMRQIGQYELGVIVGYNAAPPRAGRGSCIFLHIWGGPGTSTAGCTAMAEHDLRDLVLWMDRSRQPVLVQLPVAEHARLRERWLIP